MNGHGMLTASKDFEMAVAIVLVGFTTVLAVLFKVYAPPAGKRSILEGVILLFAVFLVFTESVLSLITSVLPPAVIQVFSILTSLIFELIPSSGINVVLADPELDDIVNNVSNAANFLDLCQLYGYEAEEHIVKTSDGYLLGIHRIGGPKGSNWRLDPPEIPRPIIYLHHGLLMNSEVWVSNIDPKKCLPFLLADMGYDVWLGNNRGNKYSRKHVSLKATSRSFWNFSIDDFALYDIPDTIKYILYIVGQKDLIYIGFSQGSAQALASLSINPALNKNIRQIIGISPSISAPGLPNHLVDSLVRASPSLMYLVFGKQAILKSAAFWQSIMYPPLYVRTIDTSFSFLFNWKCRNMSYAQKLAAYPHLYSYSSVKSVVHWFQIIRNGRFHMYDDEFANPLAHKQHTQSYHAASFPTSNVTAPVKVIYGEYDTLVNPDVLKSELPKDAEIIKIEDHEHLDLIWGGDVDIKVFPEIFKTLDSLQAMHRISSGTTSPKSALDIEQNDLEQAIDERINNSTNDTSDSTEDTPTKATSSTITSEKESLKIPMKSPREVAKQLSASFSSTGIIFGHSAPVVEVTTSHD